MQLLLFLCSRSAPGQPLPHPDGGLLNRGAVASPRQPERRRACACHRTACWSSLLPGDRCVARGRDWTRSNPGSTSSWLVTAASASSGRERWWQSARPLGNDTKFEEIPRGAPLGGGTGHAVEKAHINLSELRSVKIASKRRCRTAESHPTTRTSSCAITCVPLVFSQKLRAARWSRRSAKTSRRFFPQKNDKLS